ncbi:DMT family transporter [Grimontia sp. NTOU-MAR1]|uniref:DMT family transporter n=1 Tax=Grimontia sp. NTOU-MAR1 TaxID=3111011 RepID=UPI002DB5C0E9|nr:DMT family transporter [Grimontia sp. NTOU-MAR1]WRV99835.1 DMT family transporter [Grimontia sp. NTOU-MAR1]
MMQPNNIGKLEMILAMMLSSTIGVFVYESGQVPLNAVFYRCLFGFMFLGFYAWVRGYLDASKVTGKEWLLMLVGGVTLVVNWCFLFTSFSFAPIGVTTVAYHTQPIFVLLIAALFLRERFEPHNWLWVLVAFSGVLMIVDPFSGGWSDNLILGIGSAIIAAVFYALTTLITQRLTHIKPHLIATVHLAIGTLMMATFAPIKEVPAAGDHWYWLLALGFLQTAVMYILLYGAFQKLETPMIAVLAYVYPVATVVVDYLVYDSAITPLMTLGMVAILFAGFAMNRSIRPLQWWKREQAY